MSEIEVPDRESFFERVADYVSAAMGRPTNILVWLVLVVGWTAIFALHLVSPTGTFLPSWFTGTGYNFPLNLMTTVAELFIGFLVAAASNRTERVMSKILAHQTQVGDDDLTADQESHRELLELRVDFSILQAQHAEQGAKLDKILLALQGVPVTSVEQLVAVDRAHVIKSEEV
jgi:uncharacterized membrane protein